MTKKWAALACCSSSSEVFAPLEEVVVAVEEDDSSSDDMEFHNNHQCIQFLCYGTPLIWCLSRLFISLWNSGILPHFQWIHKAIWISEYSTSSKLAEKYHTGIFGSLCLWGGNSITTSSQETCIWRISPKNPTQPIYPQISSFKKSPLRFGFINAVKTSKVVKGLRDLHGSEASIVALALVVFGPGDLSAILGEEGTK